MVKIPFFASEISSSYFSYFLFARYAAINFDWRTRGVPRGARFKERACALVNPNQNSQFIGWVTCAARLEIRCPNARKSDHPSDE